jgi:hypothetical protein
MRNLLNLRNLMFLSLLLIIPSASFATVAISVAIAPPALPVYAQPPCPVEGYMWTPGYWGWRAEGYYWVPGVWVAPPRVGVFWTPGYWGFAGGLYGWHAGSMAASITGLDMGALDSGEDVGQENTSPITRP